MQETTLIIAIVTPFVLLLIATTALLMNTIKQKKVMRQQQQKLREFIEAIQNGGGSPATPTPSYKHFIDEQLAVTRDRFSLLAPHRDLTAIQPDDAPINQRIVVLRHAFLRAEELSTTAVQGSEGYWDIFQQALAPLLRTAADTINNSEELEIYKKRVENLEKFKSLFFDLEKRWDEAQANAQVHYNELYAMADNIADKDRYEYLLGQYNDSYNDLNQYIYSTKAALTGQPAENKTINIIRQDPRAAEEIMKLRNVAADQYRIISNLQRKLEEAVTAEEKDQLITELEQQLQRQIRFVQESDTCVQLLEEELAKANEKILQQESSIEHEQLLEEENQRIKATLHSFTRESKDLLENIEELEKENDQLKNVAHDTYSVGRQETSEQFQGELMELRKQYAELEEKYLLLKLK